jgi:nickel-dependent lactate racemase
MIPTLLRELETVVSARDITLINALGMHRRNTREELVSMLGPEIVDNYRVVQHDANDRSTQALAGRLADGSEAWVNREYLAADFRILSGFIEPHFFAGFSGGFKAVLPGISSRELILANHSARNIAHHLATWAVLDGNPVQENIREVGKLTRPGFLLNVTLNRDRRITGVFAGRVEAAHRAGTEFVRRTALRPVEAPFDIVITTNSGYPLDQNLYQTVKGMSAAARIVKPGGVFIVASECRDGIPDHGNYRKLLTMANSPEALLDIVMAPGFEMVDQWEAQIQADLQQRAHFYLKSDGLTADEIRSAHADVEASLQYVRSLLAL